MARSSQQSSASSNEVRSEGHQTSRRRNGGRHPRAPLFGDFLPQRPRVVAAAARATPVQPHREETVVIKAPDDSTGLVVSFAVLEPPSVNANFPWVGLHTLKEAHQSVIWTRHALSTCRDFVQAATAHSVRLVIGLRAQLALPVVLRWLRELGFQVRGSLIKSRSFT